MTFLKLEHVITFMNRWKSKTLYVDSIIENIYYCHIIRNNHSINISIKGSDLLDKLNNFYDGKIEIGIALPKKLIYDIDYLIKSYWLLKVIEKKENIIRFSIRYNKCDIEITANDKKNKYKNFFQIGYTYNFSHSVGSKVCWITEPN